MSLGYTEEQVDDMTLAMVGELTKYWDSNPPQHILVRIIAEGLGAWKREAKVAKPAEQGRASAQDTNDAKMAELIALQGAINGRN